MNEIDFLGRLGTRSRGATQPPIDVSARVIEQIARGRSRVVDRRLALVSVAACLLSASALAVLAGRAAKPDSDTLAALSEAAVSGTGPEAILRVLEP
jgi:hypothetical protein